MKVSKVPQKRPNFHFSVKLSAMPFEYAVYAYKDEAIDRSLLIFEQQRPTFDRVTATWQPAERRDAEKAGS